MSTALPARLPRPALRRPAWLSPRVARVEVLAGLVTALALIPEVISFSVIAGVDPRVGLFTSFVMAVTIALTGGRPAMVTAAAGAVALVVAPLVRDHGLPYLIAAVLLGGVFQVVLGLLGVAKVMRFVPRSVMVGFVNALAILIFTAQLPQLTGVPWAVYALAAGGLAVIVGLPRLTTAVPAPLVAIVVLTVLSVVAHLDVPTVGDQGELPDSLPGIGLPDVPFTLETLRIIAPYALAIAFVGLLESLMTAKLVDEITDSPSDKTRESVGQGIANLAAGVFGGMGGCAMIGQTMINVRAGARTRLSTFLAGVWLLVLVLVLSPVVAAIPMAALVAVMVFVAFTTFDWHSLRSVRRMPRSETAVMLVTVVVVVATGNLAIGVGVGVLVACVLFARRVAHLVTLAPTDGPDGERVYTVRGALFFASANELVDRFDYAGDPDRVVLDLSAAHVWDASSVAVLDAVGQKYAARGKTLEITGLTDVTGHYHQRLAGKLGSQA
jgi:SulP family sulfate permease